MRGLPIGLSAHQRLEEARRFDDFECAFVEFPVVEVDDDVPVSFGTSQMLNVDLDGFRFNCFHRP